MDRLRAAWPGVQINLRGDSGFGIPKVYRACEQLDLHYTIGIGMNSRIKKLSDSLLDEAVRRFEETGLGPSEISRKPLYKGFLRSCAGALLYRTTFVYYPR